MVLGAYVFPFLLLLLVDFCAWRGRYYTLPPKSTFWRPEISFYGCSVFFGSFFIAFFLSALFVELGWMALGHTPNSLEGSSELKALRMPLISLLALPLFFWLAVLYDRAAVQKLLRPDLSALAFGCFSWVIYFPHLLVLSALMTGLMKYWDVPFIEQNAVDGLRSAANFPVAYVLNCVAILIAAPILEEFLFRGVLQTTLRRIFNLPLAIGISAIIFALFHFSYGYGLRNIEILTYLFLLACFLGFIYERQQSLWASIGLHFFANLVSVLFINAH